MPFFKKLGKVFIKPVKEAGRFLRKNDGIGPVIGLVVAAAIPGAGTAVYAASMAAGSAAEAGAKLDGARRDKKEANRQADAAKAQEEQKIQAEQQRVTAQFAEEKARATAASEALAAEKARLDAESLEQSNLVRGILDACQAGTLDGIPALLARLNEESLSSLGNRPQDACRSADNRDRVADYLSQEFEGRQKHRAGMRM